MPLAQALKDGSSDTGGDGVRAQSAKSLSFNALEIGLGLARALLHMESSPPHLLEPIADV